MNVNISSHMRVCDLFRQVFSQSPVLAYFACDKVPLSAVGVSVNIAVFVQNSGVMLLIYLADNAPQGTGFCPFSPVMGKIPQRFNIAMEA